MAAGSRRAGAPAAVALGGLRGKGLNEGLLSTAATTGLILVVLLGAEMVGAALALSRRPAELSAAPDVVPPAVLPLIPLIGVVLGRCVESLATVPLTPPSFVPLMPSPGFGRARKQVLVWFGILVPMSVAVGMIPPRFGLNLCVMNAMAKDVPMAETCRGVPGFLAPDAPRVARLALFPAVSPWLPGLW